MYVNVFPNKKRRSVCNRKSGQNKGTLWPQGKNFCVGMSLAYTRPTVVQLPYIRIKSQNLPLS